jgi:hypothetical protein
MAKTATRSRAKPLVWNGSSDCFSDLRYSRGEVWATFRDGSQYQYPATRAEARDFFASPSVGKTFNEEWR